MKEAQSLLRTSKVNKLQREWGRVEISKKKKIHPSNKESAAPSFFSSPSVPYKNDLIDLPRSPLCSLWRDGVARSSQSRVSPSPRRGKKKRGSVAQILKRTVGTVPAVGRLYASSFLLQKSFSSKPGIGPTIRVEKPLSLGYVFSQRLVFLTEMLSRFSDPGILPTSS